MAKVEKTTGLVRRLRLLFSLYVYYDRHWLVSLIVGALLIS
jgi:hypothetical protein